jgi:hypothetical protein
LRTSNEEPFSGNYIPTNDSKVCTIATNSRTFQPMDHCELKATSLSLSTQSHFMDCIFQVTGNIFHNVPGGAYHPLVGLTPSAFASPPPPKMKVWLRHCCLFYVQCYEVFRIWNTQASYTYYFVYWVVSILIAKYYHLFTLVSKYGIIYVYIFHLGVLIIRKGISCRLGIKCKQWIKP